MPQFNGLDPNLAETMIKNYETNQLSVINANLGSLRPTLPDGTRYPSDSRSVWFSLEQIQAFISQIQGSNLPANQLGIRIYFAAYPSAPDMANPANPMPAFNPYYAGMQTVVMVPTHNNNAGTLNSMGTPNDVENDNIVDAFKEQHTAAEDSVDFDPNFPGVPGAGTPQYWTGVYQQISNNIQGGGGPTSLTMLNHGGIMPPPFRVIGEGNLFTDFTG